MKRIPSLLPLFFSAFLFSSLSADVTLEKSVKIEARGLISVFESEKTIFTRISGDNAKIESYNGEPSGSPEEAALIKLEDDKAYVLYPDLYQYEVKDLGQLRQETVRDIELIEKMPQNGPDALPITEQSCQWANPQVDVKRTGEKMRFAGVRAEQYLITMANTCEHPDTEQTCDVTWVLDYWNARRMPGDDDVADFREALANRHGTSELLALSAVVPQGLLALFENGWDEVIFEADGHKGYPVKTVMSLHIGGKQCRTRSDREITQDNVWSSVREDSISATKQSAANTAGNVIAGQVAQQAGGGLGGIIASSAAGIFTRNAANKAMDPEKKAETADVGDENLNERVPGQVQIFRITTELKSVSDENLEADSFEVPSNWEEI
jgi:hypothetical protein